MVEPMHAVSNGNGLLNEVGIVVERALKEDVLAPAEPRHAPGDLDLSILELSQSESY
jgi:hypothetical protein